MRSHPYWIPNKRTKMADDNSIQEPDSTASGLPGNVTADSAYFSSEPSLSAEQCTSRTRNSTWVASLRSLLQTQKPRLTPSRITLPVGLCGSITVPQSEEAVDRFLSEIWEKDTAENSTSEYVRKVTELKGFFDLKLFEIAQRQATCVSELLCQDAASSANTLNMKQVLLEATVSYKFDALRLTLKQQVAETVFNLRAHYIDTSRRRKHLRPKATGILNEWFERHLDFPYPSEDEKRLLASQCDITVEQVSNWLSNKRCRSKSIKTVRRRKSKG